ncbi:MAG: EAL domain-containing protein [Ectothiorhodospiraceae bacterium]|nr:EAL domain-containing protein [Ectothiorhodospiraceae bacterium]
MSSLLIPRWLRHRRLSLRVLLTILLLSSALTLAITAVQLYSEYQRDLGSLERQLQQAESTFSDTLASSLWSLDRVQLELQLHGLLQLPHVRQVFLTGDMDLQAGVASDYPRQREHIIPVVYQGGDGVQHTLGEVRMQADLAEIDGRTWDRGLLILLTQGAKTFAASLLILCAFYYLVTRHLHRMSDYARTLRLGGPRRPITLSRQQQGWFRPDELDELQDAFNHALQRMSEDLAARERAEQEKARLDFLIHFDPLTELPNRVLAYEHLTDEIHQGQPGRLTALALLDIDNFKDVNDGVGHDIGDRVLGEVAQRLRRCCEPDWIPARFGGDEFLVIITRIPDRQWLDQRLTQLLEDFCGPVAITPEQTLFLSATIGVAVAPDAGNAAKDLIQAADTAVYAAKRDRKRSLRFYRPQLQEDTQRRLRLESDLRQALAEDQFRVHYQPVVDAATREVTSLEALVRWQHPLRGLVPPDEFIPLAEENGLIVPLGAWVLETSLRNLRSLRQSTGNPHLTVAVNVSSRQLLEGALDETVHSALQKAGLPGSALQLELTERIFLHDMAETRRALQAVEAMGVTLAIDDFGTGYSALGYLRRLHVHTLKVDREFVRDISSDENDRHLIRAIISMAHDLQIRVVAEGVETREQLEFLQEYHCELAQGYLFSPPLPMGELTEHLLKWVHHAP